MKDIELTMGGLCTERYGGVSRGHSTGGDPGRTESLNREQLLRYSNRAMKKTERDRSSPMQLSLWEEGEQGQPVVRGEHVLFGPQRQVSQQWKAACRRERALTEDLMNRIAELSNLAAAMRQVVSNGGSPGIDGMTVQELRDWFAGHAEDLRQDLLEGRYRPEPVKGVEIPKPGGGTRQLGIPTCRDRLVQQAIARVLQSRYEATFSDHSYGFRPGRSAHQALSRASRYVADGYTHVVDVDLEKFFDTVCQDRLMRRLGYRIGDRRVLRLIGRFLRAGMMSEGLLSQRTKGTPQGSPLSPLLSNIVLDELDKELEARGHRFVRYADDLIILTRSKVAAERVIRSISRYIERRMRLKVNRAKSRVCRPYRLNFLGYAIGYRGVLLLSRQSEARFKAKLRRLTRRNRGISLEQLIAELNPVLRGWLGYFRLAGMRTRLAKLEGWLRHRIRCFRLKQCKRAIGIVRFLRGLGVPTWRAWLLALSGKGWYRRAGTPPAHEGMNQKWFSSIGLYSMTSNYS